MSEAFTMVNIQLKKLKEDGSELSDSEDEDEDEASHFQIADIHFSKSNF